MQRKVLVTPRPGGGDVAVAVIDFGDMVRTARVFELAIALAYACQNRPSPADALAAGRAVVLASHNAEVLGHCDLVLTLEAGLAQSFLPGVSASGAGDVARGAGRPVRAEAAP